MGARSVPCYIRIRAINDRVITKLQCIVFKNHQRAYIHFSMLAQAQTPRTGHF